jgi:hypothetical protein
MMMIMMMTMKKKTDDDQQLTIFKAFKTIVKLKTETTQAEGERGGGMSILHPPCSSLKALLSSELKSK